MKVDFLIRVLLSILLFSCNFVVYSQRNTTIVYGSVYDCSNMETLVGVSIFEKTTLIGTVTDNYGRYSLTIPATSDSLEIQVSYLGYKSETTKLEFDIAKIETNWCLNPDIFQISEVVIHGESVINANTKPLSNFKINPIELKSLPTLSGENDLLRYLQLTPGIQYANDFNSNLYVRGGDYDQNLFLLDNMPLYHVSHFGGFLSTFNSDIIKTAEIYKGSFPARFGSRLSSVVEVHTIDGDMMKHNASLSLGLLSSKLFVNGPLKKGSSSYMVSLRKNTLPLDKVFDLDVNYKFYDANVKINHKISDKDRIFFSFYNGSDIIKLNVLNDTAINSNMNVGWGNIAGSLKYNRILSARLFSNFIVGQTSYYYSEESFIREYEGKKIVSDFSASFDSRISESFSKMQFKYYVNKDFDLFFGHDFSYIVFLPGKSALSQQGLSYSSLDTVRSYIESKTIDQSLYCEANASFYGFYVNIGLRGNLISNEDLFLPNLQPRLSISRSITRLFALKASYSVANQPFHLVTNNGGGIPVEYRIQTMKNAPPSKSRQIAFGTNYTSQDGEYELAVEGFFRHMDDLVTLKDGVYFALSFDSLSNIIVTNGIGESKGVELLARKTSGNTTGWIGATLAKSTRQFDAINQGKPFPFKFDRRWEIKMMVQHQISNRIRISGTWVFATGNAFTLPQSQMTDHNGDVILIYGERNNFREKPYHRLDIAINYAFKLKRGNGSIDFSILNLYDRKNPYYYFTSTYQGRVVLYQQSQLPFLPSLSLNLFF